jgi:hypothetical protein
MRHGTVSIMFFKGRQTIFRNLYQKPGHIQNRKVGKCAVYICGFSYGPLMNLKTSFIRPEFMVSKVAVNCTFKTFALKLNCLLH